jgi:hypothetical protein
MLQRRRAGDSSSVFEDSICKGRKRFSELQMLCPDDFGQPSLINGDTLLRTVPNDATAAQSVGAKWCRNSVSAQAPTEASVILR